MHYGRWYRTGTTDPAPKVAKIKAMRCVECGDDFQTTGKHAKYCDPCKPIVNQRWQREYKERYPEAVREWHRKKRAERPDHYREMAKRRRLANPEQQKEYQRRYQEKHRIKIRLRRRAYIFGIPASLLEEMRLAQGERCAICLRSLPMDSKWCVDHCHATGTIRGILCGSCNTALGMLQDSPDLCEMAAIYLRTS